MKVVITGANSAVGQAILRCGAAQRTMPTVLVAAVRSERAAEQIRSRVGDANRLVRISYDDPRNLDAALQGTSAVIHLAGILVETSDSRVLGAAAITGATTLKENSNSGMIQVQVLATAGGLTWNPFIFFLLG